MRFLVTLIYWEYRDTLLLMMVYPKHRATVSWVSSLAGSNEALCIHPRLLELSVKSSIWYPYPSCCMVMYIDVYEVSNFSMFNIRMPCNLGRMHHHHSMPLF